MLDSSRRPLLENRSVHTFDINRDLIAGNSSRYLDAYMRKGVNSNIVFPPLP
jgi:hypothetical protein